MTLKDHRDKLDIIDKTLEEYFIKRMQIVTLIGEYKEAHGIATLDSGREAEVLAKHLANVDDEFKPYMEEYFKAMMAISRRYQNDRKAKLAAEAQE